MAGIVHFNMQRFLARNWVFLLFFVDHYKDSITIDYALEATDAEFWLAYIIEWREIYAMVVGFDIINGRCLKKSIEQKLPFGMLTDS